MDAAGLFGDTLGWVEPFSAVRVTGDEMGDGGWGMGNGEWRLSSLRARMMSANDSRRSRLNSQESRVKTCPLLPKLLRLLYFKAHA